MTNPNEYIIFPEIFIQQNHQLNQSIIKTWVRKRGTNRKWYLSLFLQTIYHNEGADKNVELFGIMGNLISDIYKFQTLGIVNKKTLSLTWNNGHKGIVLDPDQRSEIERIKNIHQ